MCCRNNSAQSSLCADRYTTIVRKCCLLQCVADLQMQSECLSNSAGLLGARLIIVISGQWQSTVSKRLACVSCIIYTTEVPVACIINAVFSENHHSRYLALSILALSDCNMCSSYRMQHEARHDSNNIQQHILYINDIQDKLHYKRVTKTLLLLFHIKNKFTTVNKKQYTQYLEGLMESADLHQGHALTRNINTSERKKLCLCLVIRICSKM